MIRAKTLLASAVVTAAAVTAFAFNSSHDGFVPEHSEQGVQTISGQLATRRAPATTSQAIASLPKLAPRTEALGNKADIYAPTVVEIATPATDADQQIDAQSQTTALADTIVNPEDVATVKAFDLEKVSKSYAAATILGMPLPRRVPQEYRLLQDNRLARLTQEQTGAEEDLLFDPAVPAARNAATDANIRERKRLRRQAARRRAAAKQSTKTASSSSGYSDKRLRHRKPFDNNRN